MMQLIALVRTENEKVKQIRKAGGLPAVVYGNKIKNVNLTIDAKVFSKLYKSAGETTLLDLDIKGESGKRSVLIHDVSVDPLNGFFTHVDFYEVKKDQKIKTHIVLSFTGESEAVKSSGGVLVKQIYKIEIEAFPKDLPHEVVVDISLLKTFQDVIMLSDLKLSPSVKIFGDPKEIIAKVMPPRTEEELDSLKQEVVMKVDEVKVETEEKKLAREAAKAAEKDTETKK